MLNNLSELPDILDLLILAECAQLGWRDDRLVRTVPSVVPKSSTRAGGIPSESLRIQPSILRS